jgi:hypothetical protein
MRFRRVTPRSRQRSAVCSRDALWCRDVSSRQPALTGSTTAESVDTAGMAQRCYKYVCIGHVLTRQEWCGEGGIASAAVKLKASRLLP